MSFARQIDVFVSRDLDPHAAALDFAQRARAGLAAELARRRGSKRYETFVDGRAGADESSVRPGGTILYEFSMAAEVAAFAMGYLRGRSPTGAMARGPRLYRTAYRDSFYASVRGRFIPPGQFQPASVPDGVEIIIGNVQPYSRKVDVQRVGNRRLRFNTPPGLFADAARAINAQFGNFVQAKAVYSMDFPGRYRLKYAQVRKGTAGRAKRYAGAAVDSPALIINPR